MAKRTEQLEGAYLATTYQVFLPGGKVDVQIDQPNDALARWLTERHVSRWVILTAQNPASEQISPENNAERQSQLECLLLERGFETYVCENVPDNKDWPIEESCFVPGLTREDGVALGRQFGQNAILYGESDGIPRLHWLDEEQQ